MYPLDRRRVALHVYGIVHSLRKTAKLIDVCHTTVSRWLKQPGRRTYPQRRSTKATAVTESIRAAVACNPFISTNKLRQVLQESLSVSVSRELVRVVIKRQGLTRKKARLHGAPANLPSRTATFVMERARLVSEGRSFVSLDETLKGYKWVA